MPRSPRVPMQPHDSGRPEPTYVAILEGRRATVANPAMVSITIDPRRRQFRIGGLVDNDFVRAGLEEDFTFEERGIAKIAGDLTYEDILRRLGAWLDREHPVSVKT